MAARARFVATPLGVAALLLPLVFGLFGAIPARAASLEIGLNFTASTRSQSGPQPDAAQPPGGPPEPGRIVPDSMGAVGPDHIVELINGYYGVFRKDDGVLLVEDTLDGFFISAGVSPTPLTYDPRIVYDPASARFFAVALDNLEGFNAPNNVLVAVSNSSDPTQGWSGFAIDTDPADQTLADFPMLGIDGEGVYVTMGMFDVPALSTYLGTDVLVIPKADLLGAVPSVANATLFEIVPISFTALFPHPVTDLDGGGLPTRLLSSTLAPIGLLTASVLTGPVTAPSLTPEALIPVQAFGQFGQTFNAEQPGAVQDFERLDDDFGSAIVKRNGSIWAVHSVVGVTGRVAIRWLEIDPIASIVLQSGLIEDPTLDYMMPSIAVNESDQVVIGFSATGEELFASAFAVLGETDAGTTTFGPPVLLAAGSATYVAHDFLGRNRFGDYSATVVDPEDSEVFWTFQEIVPSENEWAIQVTELRIASAGVSVPVDIKPGSCPNSWNRSSNGVLPVALVGTTDFDVSQIDLSSVRLCLPGEDPTDPAAQCVAPHEGPPGPHTVVADVATPFEGEACDCHELEGDGNPDLSMKFKTQDVVGALALETAEPGALVELVVTGTLLDGTPFEGSDCARLVTPGTPPGRARIQSNTVDAWIDASPLDLQLDGGGFGDFERTYPQSTEVMLTASARHAGRTLRGWQIDGGDLVEGASITLPITSDEHVVEAVYGPRTGCGLGVELALLLLALAFVHRRSRRRSG